MISIEIDKRVINDAYLQYLDAEQRIQIFYGGSSSGKSVFLAQRDIIDLLKGGRNFLVCRQVGRTLRGSVVMEARKIINEWGLGDVMSVNKTDGTITCANGYQMVFAGLDDVEKLKSVVPEKGVFTDIRIEEATETNRDTVKQLLKRQRGGDAAIKKRLTLSFNPILKLHWIYQDYFAPLGWSETQTEYQDEDISILKSWYIHNKFLTPDDIAGLENEADSYYHSVYTLGNWGVLGDVIFTNWRVEDLSAQKAQFTDERHGLDFGFSSDPAALVSSHYDKTRKRIYIYDELYERGLTNDLLANEVKNKIGHARITCDSSEPKSITELKRYNVNASGARKGKDSVLHGVQWLQQHEIIVDKNCINTQNELQLYQWKKDKDGNSMRQPVDKNNHIIDALRYAYEDDMVRSRAGFVHVKGL
jgi:phage terminase large subunit